MFESLFQKYPFFRKVPCILVMAVIFKLSSMTSNELENFPHIWDKLAHFVEYATLAGCYAMLWSRRLWTQNFLLKILILGLLTLGYGITDEIHQSFVEGRDSSALDLVADFLGGLGGGAIYVFIIKILNKFEPAFKNFPEK